MAKFKVPNTFVIIFAAILFSAFLSWVIPGAVPQTWQVFSALYEGFSQQAGIIAFVLIIGGAFWVVNATKAMDDGITRFIRKVRGLERFPIIRKIGAGNIIIMLIMLLFGIFGAIFGMSEETIAFVALVIPLAKSLGYDDITGVCMVYVAAHVGFAGAMLNPFTVGIAQDMAGLPLFSGMEYRTFCWFVLMAVAVVMVLMHASKVRKPVVDLSCDTPVQEENAEVRPGAGIKAWAVFAVICVVLLLFSWHYASGCVITIGQTSVEAPWLLWVLDGLFVLFSIISLRDSSKMFILNLLLCSVVFLVAGVMGYGWYLPEICALFLALAVAAGIAADYTPDQIAKEFVAGAKDIFSAALVIGLAAGIIVILKNGGVTDILLTSLASSLEGSGKVGALASMYGIQNFINIFIPSASAKAAVTMPIMAPFADMIGLSRQATVLAFQFGDGFTNMITPCSGVLMAVLSVARIPYERWFRWIWKFILLLIVLGFLLLLPAVYMSLPGF